VLPVSTKDLVRFTPERLKEREDAPTFFLKVPSLRDKIALDAALAVEGVRYPGNAELAQVLREGVAEHVVDDDQPTLTAILDEFEAASEEGVLLTGELLERVEQIARALRPYHRPLGRVEAERGRFLATAMLVRAELLLAGIEGEDAPPLERRSGRLSENCQQAIEERYGNGTLFAVGARTVDLMSPAADARKNSGSPEPSPPDPGISTAANMPPMARPGKSSANGTKATLGRACRRGISKSSGCGAWRCRRPAGSAAWRWG
jgi:hypothetical protein